MEPATSSSRVTGGHIEMNVPVGRAGCCRGLGFMGVYHTNYPEAPSQGGMGPLYESDVHQFPAQISDSFFPEMPQSKVHSPKHRVLSP